MIKYFLAFLCASLFFACSVDDSKNNQKISKILNLLQTNESKIILDINNKPFYSDSSIFKGGGYVNSKGVKVSLKDQFRGNVIVSIEGKDWYKNKPCKIEFKDGYPIGPNMASFLIGKISNDGENKGEGYVLYNGTMVLRYVSKHIFVVEVKGELKKPFGDEGLSPIDGSLVWKNPEYSFESLKGLENEFNSNHK